MGVGEKTARQLLSVCKTVEDLPGLQPTAQLKFRGRDEILRRIRENMEMVRMSRQLATICCDAPIEISPAIVRYRGADKKVVGPLCRKLGFPDVLADIPLTQPTLF
jgi:DNA polymerase-1